jgi:hypothetical protein
MENETARRVGPRVRVNRSRSGIAPLSYVEVPDRYLDKLTFRATKGHPCHHGWPRQLPRLDDIFLMFRIGKCSCNCTSRPSALPRPRSLLAVLLASAKADSNILTEIGEKNSLLIAEQTETKKSSARSRNKPNVRQLRDRYRRCSADCKGGLLGEVTGRLFSMFSKLVSMSEDERSRRQIILLEEINFCKRLADQRVWK